LGQLAVNRHLMVGIDWAMAGEATVDAARPIPAAFENSRRFMAFPLQSENSADDARTAMNNSNFLDCLEASGERKLANGSPIASSPAVQPTAHPAAFGATALLAKCQFT
jgi:hypothetical protein